MLYNYRVTTGEGKEQAGSIDAPNVDSAINSLQRRGLIVISVESVDKKGFFAKNISWFDHVSQREVVILSRQIATLFEANVSVLNAFELLATETGNIYLSRIMQEIADDIRAGGRISVAMAKHVRVFSPFYVNMVKAGEESGKLSETFNFLADYLERSYELTRKAKNALVYPIFVVIVFVAVMILMLIVVIPQLSSILLEAGQKLPLYTRIIIGTSNFFINYGPFLLVLLIVGAVFMWRYSKTSGGKRTIDEFRLGIPYVGDLYKKLYLSRISDNIDTMLSSGISMLHALEVSADVVGSQVYAGVLMEIAESVKGGSSVAESFGVHKEIPQIVVQMTRIGEETGKLGFVLKTMARFYKREVDSAVDTLVGLIEPLLILVLGLMVGIMLAGILLPIYSITAAI
ncbi:MAG TPA: type II secretion system F family protein [Candidatus Paceibacterota bacterium]